MNRRARNVAVFFVVTLALGFIGWGAKVQGVIDWPWPLALIGFAPTLLFAAGVLVCAAIVFLLTAADINPFD